MGKMTHIDEKGKVRMVNVGEKPVTQRTAVARGTVMMNKHTFEKVLDGDVPKGDVFAAARIAGIMAAKKTPELIPLCHPLFIDSVEIDIRPDKKNSSFIVKATVSCTGKTGVEMEALTAVSTAALTMYDMCKSLDKSIEITGIHLLKKTGGKSGDYVRK
ncbi:cyclic pyranopterin monophosphate synthase MoaC [candidate division KSB1 bacterium]|nr:cyclic pyranopterin monophosphate synthase MoaC [candidate division KSB1 bacterium]